MLLKWFLCAFVVGLLSAGRLSTPAPEARNGPTEVTVGTHDSTADDPGDPWCCRAGLSCCEGPPPQQ